VTKVATPLPPKAPIFFSGGGMAPRNAIEACISRRENGGSYARSSNPTHFGRWQLSHQLWTEFAPGLESRFPGITGRWGFASPAEQDAVFVAVVARNPSYSDWRPYDGC
jgi:muramidase (phage lysozyme)